jgi:peroxiredoxin
MTFRVFSVLGIDRIFEGDPAPTDCFEELVSIKSGNAIGSTGKQRLVPWLHKNPSRHSDFVVIITEPRLKSPELYETVTTFQTLPLEIKNKIIIINADSPSENRRWLKKSGYDDEKVVVYSDEKREFMRTYTALGEHRWGLTMFILASGRVQKLARDIDQYGASRAVQNAVKALNEVRL